MPHPLLCAWLASIGAVFRSRRSLWRGNVALRHQVAVYQRAVQRPPLRPADRLFWARLSRLWSGWQDAWAFVQPRRVLAWQRTRLRDHGARLSRGTTPGRPVIATKIRAL